MASKPKKSTTKTATKQSSTPKKMGRPKKQIDKAQFEAMCGIQCTRDEICAILGIEDDTLNRWCKETYDGRTFSAVFAEKRAVGKMSLRRSQFNLAKKSAAMAIFLGKNYLGQTDQVEVVDNTPIEKLDAILGGLKDIAIASTQGAQDGNTTVEPKTE